MAKKKEEKKKKSSSESDFMPASASPSDFAVPYHISISPTFRHSAGTCFHEFVSACIWHLKSLKSCILFFRGSTGL